MHELKIRQLTKDDSESIWMIFQQVVEDGNAFCSDESITEERALSMWISPSSRAATLGGKIVGAYSVFSLNWGRGSHVADGAIMIERSNRSKRIGLQLATSMIRDAKDAGFLSMVFTSVVSSNVAAISLWKKVGFKVVGTLPNAFRLRDQTLVDTHVMHLDLTQ